MKDMNIYYAITPFVIVKAFTLSYCVDICHNKNLLKKNGIKNHLWPGKLNMVKLIVSAKYFRYSHLPHLFKILC